MTLGKVIGGGLPLAALGGCGIHGRAVADRQGLSGRHVVGNPLAVAAV